MEMINNFKNNKTIINGIEINIPSNSNITISNGKVFVNGVEYRSGELEGKQAVNIIIKGNVNNIKCDGYVICNDVTGNIDCGGSCNCGDVNGSIDAGGSINCGDVKGDIDAGGSVRINKK